MDMTNDRGVGVTDGPVEVFVPPRFTVFIDLDGTLRDARKGRQDAPRPYVLELFRGIKALGGQVVMWSGASREYVEHGIRSISPEAYALTTACLSKLEVSINQPLPSCCVDDQIIVTDSRRKHGWGGFWVPYYESDQDDSVGRLPRLLQVLQDIEQWAGTPASEV